MVYNPDFRPRKFVARYDKDGKILKPEMDAYLCVVTKHYGEDGRISARNWFYSIQDVETWNIYEGTLMLAKHVNGRHQDSFIPLSEILRFDLNSPSEEFKDAMEIWTQQEFSMTLTEYLDMSSKGNVIKAEEALKNLFGGSLFKLGDPDVE